MASELEQRRHVEAQLRESEERLRLALAAAGMGAWEWDIIADRLIWSPEVESLHGVAHGAFEGTYSAFLELVHPEDRSAVQEVVARALATEGELALEYRIRRGQRAVRWLATRGQVWRGDSARPPRMLGTVMDVTARKEAEQQRDLLARSEKLRALGYMASGIAHDLNQVLTLLIGNAGLAREALLEPTPNLQAVDEALRVMADTATCAGESVERLLTFGRVQAEGDLVPVRLAPLLQEVAQFTAPRWRDTAEAEGRPIRVQVTAESDAAIAGWPAALREVLTNLVFNAVDALPNGGSIHLAARQTSDQVEVTVADTGLGMPPEVRARIFEPFFSTKRGHGTGLGLAMVASLVEQHRGRIEVDSAPGRGTTFRLLFPAAQPRAEVRQSPADQTTRPQRVLVVDDESAIRRMCQQILQGAGHVVVVAASAEDALEQLQVQPFDVVVSDLSMGSEMNGWELAARVREQWPRTRFVLSTGWAVSIDSEQARARGIQMVLAKPYGPADLRRAVASAGHKPMS